MFFLILFLSSVFMLLLQLEITEFMLLLTFLVQLQNNSVRYLYTHPEYDIISMSLSAVPKGEI